MLPASFDFAVRLRRLPGPGSVSVPARGFTLIEMMIVVAVVGILSAVAYPAYTNSVIKGKRSEGRTALTDLMQQQERYLTQTGSYGYGGAAISLGNTTVPFKMYSGNDLASSAYTLGARACSITPAPALTDCVEVYATPKAPFVDSAAGTLFIRSTGEKGCSVAGSTVCWK